MENGRDPGAAIGESRGTLWTIGHSTRSFEEFHALLAEHRIQFLADVRHFPTSQRVPWTAKTSLAKALSERGIAYEHVEALGGFRRARPDSVNLGWRNSGFRGYADHIATAEFSAGLGLPLPIASGRRAPAICARGGAGERPSPPPFGWPARPRGPGLPLPFPGQTPSPSPT